LKYKVYSIHQIQRNHSINIQTGEHVHHPQHGVGKVQSIRKRSFYGHEAATYAQLYFERDDLTLTVLEKDLRTTVRTLVTPEQTGKLLDQIRSWDGKAKPQWKARAETHQAAIDGGDPFEYARAAKELSRMETVDELRPRDKANLARSLRLLTEEISRALKKTPAQAAELIQSALDE